MLKYWKLRRRAKKIWTLSARLEKKLDDLIDQVTGSNTRADYREGSSKGAKAVAIFIVTVAASLGGILLELGKITWTALTGHR